MDRTTSGFRLLITALLSAALFFGVSAEARRRTEQTGSGRIASGDLVKLVRVLDGDAAQVSAEGQDPVIVRLIGIKSFDAKVAKDVGTPFAQAAVGELQHVMTVKATRVLLADPPQDRRGRYLATLYLDDEDVALHLVRRAWSWSTRSTPSRPCPSTSRRKPKPEASVRGSGQTPLPSGVPGR